ncbi:MAG: hypothetical protein ACXVEC_07005 [Nocardioides sp.]
MPHRRLLLPALVPVLVPVLVLALAGCDGTSSSTPTGASSDASRTATSGNAIVATLAEVCDQVGPDVPAGRPTAAGVEALQGALDTLARAGDADTRAALRPFVEATARLARSSDPAAQQAWRRAADDLAATCRDAGSSAFH